MPHPLSKLHTFPPNVHKVGPRKKEKVGKDGRREMKKDKCREKSHPAVVVLAPDGGAFITLLIYFLISDRRNH